MSGSLAVVAVVVIIAVVAVYRLLGVPVVPAEDADAPIELDGSARLLQGTRYLQYRVGLTIDASPERIWALLTDAAGYPSWNSEVLSIGGRIAKDETIELKAKVAPDRTFKLRVAVFDAPRTLVWQDGNRIFRGVRTFHLAPHASGTAVTMNEVLTGTMLPQIAPKLPDFRPSFEAFLADLKKAAEA